MWIYKEHPGPTQKGPGQNITDSRHKGGKGDGYTTTITLSVCETGVQGDIHRTSPSDFPFFIVSTSVEKLDVVRETRRLRV